MRVRIYCKDQAVIIENVEFIRDVNTVRRLSLHESWDLEISIEIQAQPQQVFTLENGYLNAFEAGHVVGEGQIVWDDRLEQEAECPSCGRVFTMEN